MHFLSADNSRLNDQHLWSKLLNLSFWLSQRPNFHLHPTGITTCSWMKWKSVNTPFEAIRWVRHHCHVTWNENPHTLSGNVVQVGALLRLPPRLRLSEYLRNGTTVHILSVSTARSLTEMDAEFGPIRTADIQQQIYHSFKSISPSPCSAGASAHKSTPTNMQHKSTSVLKHRREIERGGVILRVLWINR